MHYIKLIQTANSSMQYKINMSVVFHYIWDNGETYRNEIASTLGMSLPAVNRAVIALIDMGFVEISEVRRNVKSRTVPYYRVVIEDVVILTIDYLKGLIGSFQGGNLVCVQKLSSLSNFTIEAFTNEISDYVLNKLQRKITDIKSICIGFPGIVDEDKGMVITAIYHRDLEGISIKEVLEKKYNCQVFIDNVVNIAVYANYCEFNKKYKNIVSFDLGMEMGAGLLINGQTYRGEGFIAGETGFFVHNLEDPIINYKMTNTFRSLCVDAELKFHGKKLDVLKIEEDYCREIVNDLFVKANQGDSDCLELIDSYIERIVLMLNKVDVLLNPRIIVLSGDVCQLPNSEHLFLDVLNKKFNCVRKCKEKVCYSKFGALVTLQGGGETALENYISKQFPYKMGE